MTFLPLPVIEFHQPLQVTQSGPQGLQELRVSSVQGLQDHERLALTDCQQLRAKSNINPSRQAHATWRGHCSLKVSALIMSFELSLQSSTNGKLLDFCWSIEPQRLPDTFRQTPLQQFGSTHDLFPTRSCSNRSSKHSLSHVITRQTDIGTHRCVTRQIARVRQLHFL